VIALMVGGPAHGQAWTVPDPPPPVLMVPRERDWSIHTITFDHVEPIDPPHQYEMRRLKPQPWAEWPLDLAYLCMAEPKQFHPIPDPQARRGIYYAHVARTLWLQALEDALPECVVPGCTDKGRYIFVAAEPGRLAGRDWEPGDQIRICPRHGHDIYRAQGARGMNQLAEWLRPDATWDWIDAYDSGDLRYGAEILERTARMLHILTPKEP